MRWPLAFPVVVLAGCVRLSAPPTYLADDPAFAPPEVVEHPGVSEDPAEEFRLSPGDVVTLRTFSGMNQEHSGLLVDERGLLHLPLVGDVEVGGQSLTEAERRIEEALRTYDQAVRATIVLEEPLGHQATVLGAVREPGRHPVVPGMRVADLLAAAGGPLMSASAEDPNDIADLAGAQIRRAGETLPISVELAAQGDPQHNVRVRAGDHLFVPASRGLTITVLGEVREPRIVGYRRGVRLTQALAMAGGLAPDAHRSDIRVVRGSLDAPRVYRTNLRDLVDGDGPDVELAPGDIVFVTRTGLASIRDVLSALNPLLFSAQNAGVAVGVARLAR